MTLHRRLLNFKTKLIYKTNKFKYDTQKTAERIWYGSKNVGNATVQVPFMITANMKQELANAGFPSNVVAKFTPQEAHDVLIKKQTYEMYQALPKINVQEISSPVLETNNEIAIVPTSENDKDTLGHDEKKQENNLLAVAVVPEEAKQQ
ncbi:hypothetical protein THRCLA_20124 [Thraustotheca clavata]|uniref:Uncharacterized protein n=1 Tax=Thraustotheca clavata TaxID=74557 RepID=A0A1W0ABL1_9STRA|nr:hypothetical protein THRCLA_20124 [Thraustotheca clavata]